MIVFAIDPGNKHSAFALLREGAQVLEAGKIPNEALLRRLLDWDFEVEPELVAIEMIASYGMAVGQTVFDTCVWLGRFQQVLTSRFPDIRVELVPRLPVKLHHCHSPRAKDSSVILALVDRFAPGAPNRGKGTKANPGWFYGFSADVWQAYALGVYAQDTGLKGD